MAIAKKEVIIPPVLISDECSTLVFVETDISAKSTKAFYKEIVSLLSIFQLALTLGYVDRKNEDNGWRKFPGLDNKLAREGFRNVTSMELLSLLPGGNNNMDPFYLYAIWSAEKRDASITIRSSLRSLINWKAVAESLLDKLSPAYGFGFRRDHKNHPPFFAIGLGGSIDDEDCRRNSGWSMAKKDQVCREGLIRDVFEWNFLSKPQLDRPVNNSTLKEWIEKDKNRGTLSSINDDLTLWEVESQHQPAIFQTLNKADVIYERDRHKS